MAAKHNFWRLLGAEHYKLRRNPAVWLMICYPLITTTIAILSVYGHRTEIDLAADVNPWMLYTGRNIVLLNFIYPIIVAIMCYSLFEAEWSRNNFRLLFTLPYKRLTIYATKIVFMAEVVAVSMAIGAAAFLAHGPVMEWLIPAARYSEHDVMLLCMSYFSRLFVSLFFIAQLQYLLNMTFRNFVVPIGVSCFMVIFTMVAGGLKVGYLIPYYSAYHLIDEFRGAEVAFDRFDFAALAYVPVVFVAGYFAMRKIYVN